MNHAPIRLYSFVGGGPSARLARALRGRGHQVREVELFSLSQWRRLSSGGKLLRSLARLSGYSLFPLLAAIDSLSSPKAVRLATSNPFYLPGFLALARPRQHGPIAVWLYDWMPAVITAAFPATKNTPLELLTQ